MKQGPVGPEPRAQIHAMHSIEGFGCIGFRV